MSKVRLLMTEIDGYVRTTFLPIILMAGASLCGDRETWLSQFLRDIIIIIIIPPIQYPSVITFSHRERYLTYKTVLKLSCEIVHII